jgi:hypothetical protein
VALPAGQIFPFDTISETSIQTTTDAGGTVELKGIDFSGGTITVHMVNNFNHNVDGFITFSSLLNHQNQELTLHFNLDSYGATKDTTIDLIDYHLNAYYPAKSAYNYFYYRVQGSLTTKNNSVSTGDNIAIQVSATNPVFSRITGKVNYSIILDNQSISVDFIPKDLNINIQHHFVDPKIRLDFINSFGIPIFASFTQFRINNRQNLPVNLVSNRSQVGDLQIPDSNKIAPARVNQTDTTTTYYINQFNSNITNAFDYTPTSLDFGGKVDLGDATSNHDYFVNSISKIRLLAEAEVPFYGWVTINMTDTMSMADMKLPKLDSINKLDITTANIKFILKVANAIPFDVYLKVDCIDTINHVTTNIINSKLIKCPTVGSDGISNQIADTTNIIHIDRAKYDKIAESSIAKIFFRFDLGKVGQSVKVLSTDKLRIRANFYIDGTIKPKL